MPVTGQLAPGVLLAGKYRIERELGSGGMGAVFLAENVDLGRRVAIKVLHPQAAANPEVLARFRQEARAAAAIGHPGIVDVLDLGRTEDGGEFIVMEHLQGESLGQRLARQAPLPVVEAVRVMDALADALDAAHGQGIVHRDLKPDNVFLVAAPVPAIKIVDFGISKLTQGPERGVRTATGAVLGTPMYMSPEQVNADRELGPAADLYALGAIGYEMLCGQPPFRSGSWAHLLLQIINDSPAPLAELRPGLPEELCELVMQLLAKTPAERPPRAAEVRQRIAELKLPTCETDTPLPLAATLSPAPGSSETDAPLPLAATLLPAPGSSDAATADAATADTALPDDGAGLADARLANATALADTAASQALADTTAQSARPANGPALLRSRRLVLTLAVAGVLIGAPALYLTLRGPTVAPVVVSPDSASGRDAGQVQDLAFDVGAPGADLAARTDSRRRAVRSAPARPKTRRTTRPRLADPLAPLPNVLRDGGAHPR